MRMKGDGKLSLKEDQKWFLFVFLLTGKDIWEGKVETREIEEYLDHFNHYETH